MQRILVSACLLGEPVRYDGRGQLCRHDILQRWCAEGRVVPVCPEVAGGLPVPRLPAEISNGAGGAAVLEGTASVVGAQGEDLSLPFVRGAQRALSLAREKNIRVAILKEGSPSCGSGSTYDGNFSGNRTNQPGVTTAILRQAGIQVFNEDQLAEADRVLGQRAAENPPPTGG